ncbi:unnamed protein product [Cunninghamella echinulata]
MSMDSQNVLKSKTNQPLGHRRQASVGLGIITNLDTKNNNNNNTGTTNEGATPEPTTSTKNASFFDTSNLSTPIPPPRLKSIEPISATAATSPINTPLLEPTTTYASRLRNIAAALKNNKNNNILSIDTTDKKKDEMSQHLNDLEQNNNDNNDNKDANNTNNNNDHHDHHHHHQFLSTTPTPPIPIQNNNKVRRARSYRFRPPYYHGDDDDDEIMPLPSPLPASTSNSSTSSASSSLHSNLLSKLKHDIPSRKTSSTNITTTNTINNTNNNNTHINTHINTNNNTNTNTNNTNNNNNNNASSSSSTNITSPHSPVTPPSPSTSTSIPILAISPTFVSNANVIPRLSEHPMLADVDDQIFIDHIQRQQHQQQQQQQQQQQRQQQINHSKIPTNNNYIINNNNNNNKVFYGGGGAMVRETSQSSHYQTLKNGQDEDLIDKQVGDFYVKRLLGVGAFSKVYLAERHQANHPVHLFAIKTINKLGMFNNPRVRSSIEREVGILKLVDHPQIVHIEATMETEHSLCIILEYAEGVELFDFVQDLYQQRQKKQEKVDEKLIKGIFLQLVQVVKWLHKHNIVHRDLKLENIMIHMNKQHQPILKVTDFGLARVIDPDSPLLTTRCGSEEYAAPEIVQSKKYDGRQTDTWALGVILYTLLVGYLPFRYDPTKNERVTQMFYRIVRAQVKWPKTWDQSPHLAASPEAKHLVEQILVRQPEHRLNLDDIEQSVWLTT